MPSITYTPTRELVSGSTGVLNFQLTKCDRTQKSIGKEHTSLSGYTESVLYRIENEWNLTVAPFDNSELPYWREFAASCANGESFELDLTGVPGGFSGVKNFRLKRNSYKESRVLVTDFSVSFTAVEI